MKRLHYLLLALIFIGCQPQNSEQADANSYEEVEVHPIVGAWQLTDIVDGDGNSSPVHNSIVIYTEGFYSVEVALEDRPSWPDRPEDEEVAEEDIRNAYNGLISNSGRYAIEGDSIIHNVIVAKWPNFMNDFPRSATAFNIDGDQMTTTNQRGTWNYRRLR